MLTGVNLLLRFVGTSFQVYLSGRIGASGIGLLQLVMSVGGLAMVAGIGGIRTATMYLTAEELGKNRPHNVTAVGFHSSCIGLRHRLQGAGSAMCGLWMRCGSLPVFCPSHASAVL